MKSHAGKIFHNNPLFYLGFLGFLGIIGICISAPILISFLLCFPFFAYGGMVADELFWEHVRRAGFRAFLSGFGFGMLWQLLLIPRAIQGGFSAPVFIGGVAQISQDYYLQMLLGGAAFVLTFMLMLAVFSGSMLVFRHREKKGLQEEA